MFYIVQLCADSDLPALVLFAAVAQRRSFRATARDLGLSVSALSHAINGLEASLGVRLLDRTTRSVAPTEAGLRMLEGLTPALAAIDEAVETAGTDGGGPFGLDSPYRTAQRGRIWY